MRVAAAHNQGNRWEFDFMCGLEHHCVNVSFDVIHADERDSSSETN